jgi:hypothetical protein
MAEQKRNLNIPIYDAGVVPEGESHGDVIDVEVIENGPKLGERVKSRAAREAAAAADALRNARVNGMRDALFVQPRDTARTAAGKSNARVDARQEGRARRSAQAQERAAVAADAKQAREAREALDAAAKLDPLVKLKLDTVRAGETYMESLRKSGVLTSGQTKTTQRKQLSDMHQVYASMMVLQAVQPLQQGINAKSIASVLGMGASMWMLSPNFRTQVGNFAGQMGDVIRGKIEGREGKKGAKAKSKFEALASKGKGDQLAGRWQKRLDKMEHAERGHRLPFTAQSAAMTEVALAEAAYADVRRPGADPRAIQDRYVSALSALYEYVDDDGIDREDVSRSMRVIVGQRLEQDPAIANVFSELGHGRFTKSEPREVIINATGELVTVWTGDFIDSYEARTISKGSFRLRPPMGISEHRVLSTETIAAELTSATSVGELNDALSQYVVAASVQRYPDVIDQLEDPAARRRLGKARTMFASMAADGLSPEEQHFAYTAAYVDAVEVAQRLNPELGAEWAAQYGDQWREKVAEEMRAYSDLGADAESAKRETKSAAPFDAPAPGKRFTATADGSVRDARNPAEKAYSTEDIVDAEVVDDVAKPRHAHTGNAAQFHREEAVYEGLIVDDAALEASDDIIDGEIVEDERELGAGQARAAILGGAKSSSSKADYDRSVDLNSTSARVRRARVNQHYNEVETGGIAGIGSDDAAPLQDVDFQLG